ncbi:hypothetical protein BVC80_9047g14 [Macleaya cordata]|uniref:Membrane-associated kinase regulator n=1 Tax=Macleaya cordata TaxID=56857 RepID=A0A200R2W8_MACCD|nr:hypothetical protein BVC80_9047g14 [Macleaya cordata]
MPPYSGDYEKLVDHNSGEEEVEVEEEALSLCDLPIKVTNEENQQSNKTPSLEIEDFEFGSWVGSLLTESEICAADDVFFQGQILPLRLSVSSENGLPGTRQDSRNPSRCGSRSESLDHCSSGVYTSRSSSSKSHHSSSSSTTTTSTTYKPLKNIFHSHPSPKPQIWNSGSRLGNARVRTGKSTTWGLFRVGLVKTPQIELQDLKLRNNKSFNSSCSSSSSNSIKNIRVSVSSNDNGRKGTKNETKLEKKKMQRFIFESCKCSVDAVESTVASKIVVIKSINNNSNKKKMMSGRELMKEDELKEEKEKEKEKQGKQKEMNHRRTFEWLKELSIAGLPDEA